jgi:hypothetical protein
MVPGLEDRLLEGTGEEVEHICSLVRYLSRLLVFIF